MKIDDEFEINSDYNEDYAPHPESFSPTVNIEESNKARDERQEESTIKWKAANGKGTLNLITRFGKTKVAKMIYEKCRAYNPKLITLVIAPNIITKDNMLKYISDDGVNTRVVTISQFINSFKTNRNPRSVDLLILEEVHNYLDGEALKAILKIKSTFILGLTGAKLTYSQNVALKSILHIPVIDVVTEVEALLKGWISRFVEYNVPVHLSEDDKKRYAKYSELIRETTSLFSTTFKQLNDRLGIKLVDSSFDLAMACYIGKMYVDKYNRKTFYKPNEIRERVASINNWSKDMVIRNKYDAQMNSLWNPDNLQERCKAFRDFIKSRNDILIYNRPKIDAVMTILKRNDVPSIVFNESTKMVDTLSEQYPRTAIAYHSNIESRFVWDSNINDIIRTKKGEPKKIGKTGLKKLAIEGIKDGRYKYLITAKALNEGLTIENIEQVITTGGSTNPNTHNQRVARGKTLDYLNPDKCCTIINLFIDDFELDGHIINSRDKEKLILRQSECEIRPIWVLSLDEVFI